MGYINQPFDFKTFFDDIFSRLRKLETAGRFTAPIVTSDPVASRNGDIWYNSTSGQLKFKDNAGIIRIITIT